MSSGALIAIGVVVLLALALALLAGVARRRDTGEAIGTLSRETSRRDKGAPPIVASQAAPTGREVERSTAIERREPSTEVVPAGGGAVAPWVPPDPDVLAVTRRQFLNRSIVSAFGFGLTAFGLTVIGFLWPSSSGGFGSKIRVGKLIDIKANIAAGKGFYYVPEGRMWITAYPSSALEKAKKVYSPAVLPGMEAGVVALYQKCVHLGCRVPNCLTSQWFECPCHGSQYNRVGEKKGGPAPRGLDRFEMIVDGESLIVNTGNIILGPVIGTNTTGQEAEGPHCVGGAKH
ncbi:MAG: ubiquinol-cytochrome c reductase iron-sulfur subunit [Acidimicrobiales bacterium]